jgi:4-carboxymuconolactone decarboxylase
MLSAEATLRRLTIGDRSLLSAIADLDQGDAGVVRLDERAEALVRLGVLVALDAPVSAYHAVVAAATLAGASFEDIVACLLAVAGEVGTARVISAAPRIAMAAGYDVDAALEETAALER